MNVEGVSGVFIDAVDMLLNGQADKAKEESSIVKKEKVSGKQLYILTNNACYLNFRVPDFKKALLSIIPAADYKVYMRLFRTLQYIICTPGRFTNTQFISKKSVRVITVDREKYELLQALRKGNL